MKSLARIAGAGFLSYYIKACGHSALSEVFPSGNAMYACTASVIMV